MRRITLLVTLLVLVAPTGGTPAFTPRVEVFGDLSGGHVAVVVPGSDVDGERFDATVGLMAARLRAQRPDVAVVAWLGYRTPRGLGVDAASGRLARVGAVALREYVRGLRGHVHLLCHSYGTLVCADAVRGLPVDDVVFLGSPGVRFATAADLGTTARVWAARGSSDWTRWVPKIRFLDLGHGTDPTAESFGARVFDTGEAHAHDEYFTPGTASLAMLARIAAGEVS
ncbi:hypothetical protein GCM10022243_08710 [Saccharothrix violaceirubra]|uniref:DUF1023 domain-containing protein n=1 Tax=Saccharothrix violaceirubra TaxID=413306 RepID=A0A7W7SZM9_9PSEU|nr:alpha/beta hydrolase [Saccharothrix violaceirubra]MBB4963282.1 hypothetical protein [Saccharothrix violaceirubra]